MFNKSKSSIVPTRKELETRIKELESHLEELGNPDCSNHVERYNDLERLIARYREEIEKLRSRKADIDAEFTAYVKQQREVYNDMEAPFSVVDENTTFANRDDGKLVPNNALVDTGAGWSTNPDTRNRMTEKAAIVEGIAHYEAAIRTARNELTNISVEFGNLTADSRLAIRTELSNLKRKLTRFYNPVTFSEFPLESRIEQKQRQADKTSKALAASEIVGGSTKMYAPTVLK